MAKCKCTDDRHDGESCDRPCKFGDVCTSCHFAGHRPDDD